MSVSTIHPERLLDLDARGELSPAQAEQLEAHLAACPSCRLERVVRRDFREVHDQPFDEGIDVQRLLSAALAPHVATPAVEPPRRTSSRWSWRPALLAAAVMLLASAAAATGWQGIRVLQARSRLVASDIDTTTDSPRVASPARRAGHAPTVREAPSPVEVPAPEVDPAAPPPVDAPPVAAPLPRTEHPVVSQAPVHATAPRVQPAVTPSDVASPPAAGQPATTPVPDAAGLFSHANRARWGGDHDRALELYRTLVEWYPGSTEAHESQAVLGSMLLVDGDAGAALHCFDNYLRTGGALREDVMADRARALGRLGRAHDELQAWSDLLRAFPASVHASFASSRLRELGAR